MNIAKINVLYKTKKEIKQKLTSLDDLFVMIRGEKYQKQCNKLRYALNSYPNIAGMKLEETAALPQIQFGMGEKYTGYVLLTFKAHDGWINNIRFLAEGLPQTLMCFVGASANSLKVVVAFTLPDGTLPELEQDVDYFHQHAYFTCAKFYEAELGTKCQRIVPKADACCRMSVDELVYLNDKPLAMTIQQPHEGIEKKIKRELHFRMNRTSYKASRETGIIPGYERQHMAMAKFQSIFLNIINNAADMDMDEIVTELAKDCQRNGLEEEFSIKRLMIHAPYCNYDYIVRNCFRNVYDTSAPKSDCAIPKATIELERLRTFLAVRYAFRRNIITGDSEYMQRDSFIFNWFPITKEALNTMTINAMAEGIDAWDKDIKRFIESSFTEDYDPIAEWLTYLPEWDGEDRIDKFASRVNTDNEDWIGNYHTWFLGMVSQWMHKNTMHGNSLVPMLIGAQGDGKSTFCRMIIPDEQQIYYTDRVDFTKKDEAVKALSRFILINIDEYDSISKRQTAFLKYMLQTVDVKYRNLYESITQQHRRYATFIATTNNPQPLVDETGSRRYMCIKVTGKIDTKTAVNYEQMYAQAIAEIKSGAKAYFNNEDERKMQLSNNDFQQFDCVDEIFSEIFHRPQKGEKSLRLTATEIVQEMKKKYRNIAVNNSNIMRVGHILNRQRYNMIRGNARRYDVAMNNK